MDYDFTEHYEKGDVVYQTRYIERVGIQEVNQLKLHTITPTWMVGNISRGNAFSIGLDQKDNIFKELKEAKKQLKKISKNAKQIKEQEIPSQLLDEYEEEENLDSYIDGDSEE